MNPPTKINDRISVAGQIAPSDVAALASQGFKVIMNNRPDAEEPGQPSNASVRAEAEKHGMSYIEIPVTGPTLNRAAVDAFHKVMTEAPGPVLAHCRSGTRSHTLWSLTQAIYNKEDPAKLAAEAAQRGFDLSALPMIMGRMG